MSAEIPFRLRLRVRYIECDMQKVVFNSRYAEYVDVAFTEFMRALGYGAHDPAHNPELQLVRQLLEWQGSARFDDVLDIRVWTTKLGTTSLSIRTELHRDCEPAPLATVETTYVHVDPHSFMKSPLPEHLRTALTRGAPGVIADQARTGGADVGAVVRA